MDENRMRRIISQSLSRANFPDARKQQVFEEIKGEKPMKKKWSVALVCAMVLTMLAAGAALAAALGVFGQLGQRGNDAHRLEQLEKVSDVVNISIPVAVPEADTAIPKTVYDEILACQHERSFELTLNQTYYDGNKLYYSYTLTTDDARTWQGEGKPTGISEWLMEESGKRYEEVWSHDIPGRDKAIQSWLGSHESSWIAHENWALGDGASSRDGCILEIISSDETMEGNTLRGYQEVVVPDELKGQESLEIELTVLYGATLYHQDESGVRCAHITQEENRGILRLPFTVHQHGTAQYWQGEAAFAHYTAKAELCMSDVEMSGKILLQVPAVWTDTLTARIEGEDEGDVILDYHLMADGQLMRNHGGRLHTPASGQLEIDVLYDLPTAAKELALVPEYAKAGLQEAELIPIRLLGQ